MSRIHTLTKQADSRPTLGAITWSSLAPLVAIVALSLLAYWAQGKGTAIDFWSTLLCGMGINVILAVSLNLVNGFTGQFSIGHAGFAAVGAYVAGWVTYYGSLLIWDSPMAQEGWFPPGAWLFAGGCLAGGLVAGVLGFLVGLPSLRLRGDYLAIVTLGFGEIMRVLITQTTDVLMTADEVRQAGLKSAFAVGGALGFGGVPWYNNLFWTTLFTGLTLLVCYRLKQSSTGRAFLSVREDEIAAQAMGINLTNIKVRAFVIAAALAGVGGGLLAHQFGNNTTPNDANFVRSFDILIPVVLGGLGSISGAVLAAALLTLLPEILRNPGEYLPLWPWFVGVALAAAVVALLVKHRRALREVCWAVAILAVSPAALALAGWACKKPGWITTKGFELGEYRMILFALVLVLVMILRPQGLFGVHEIWEAGKLFKLRKKPTTSAIGAMQSSSMPVTREIEQQRAVDSAAHTSTPTVQRPLPGSPLENPDHASRWLAKKRMVDGGLTFGVPFVICFLIGAFGGRFNSVPPLVTLVVGGLMIRGLIQFIRGLVYSISIRSEDQ